MTKDKIMKKQTTLMPSELWKISLVKLKIRTSTGKTPVSRARKNIRLVDRPITFVTQVTHCYLCSCEYIYWPFFLSLTILLRQSGIFYHHEHLYHAKFVVVILFSMHE